MSKNSMMKNDYKKLINILYECGIEHKQFANDISIHPTALSSKLSGNRSFTLKDIKAILKVLDMKFEEVF